MATEIVLLSVSKPCCPSCAAALAYRHFTCPFSGALQAPGLPYQLPRQLAGYPALSGRAIVELTVEKASGAKVGCVRSCLDLHAVAGCVQGWLVSSIVHL